MLKRLAAVALAYATRRLLWLWGAVYLAILIGIGGLVPSRQSAGPARSAGLPAAPVAGIPFSAVSSADELSRMITKGREAEVEALDCRRDWNGFASALEAQRLGQERGPEVEAELFGQVRQSHRLPEFDRFPNLRRLDLGNCVLFPDDVRRLAQCRSLEWLSLELTVIVDRDFRFLEGLDRLETLILGTIQSGTDQPPNLDAAQLPRLRTLVFRNNSRAETSQALLSLGGSPLLRDLVFRSRVDANALALVNTIPTLRRLFVSGYGDDAAGFRELQAALPQVTVWHAELDGSRLYAAQFLFFATLALGFGMLMQMQGAFSVPAARLFPNYRTPHLAIPLTIIAIGLFAEALIVGRFGADLWAALSIGIFAVGAMAVIGALGEAFPRIVLPARRRSAAAVAEGGPATRSITTSALIGIPMLLAVGFSVVFLVMNPFLVESFLLGEFPSWNLGFALAGAALLAGAAALGARLNAALNEAGLAPMLSYNDMQQRGLKIGLAQRRGLRSSQRRLDRLPPAPNPPTWGWQVRAIGAGNPNRFRWIHLVSFPVVMLMVGRSAAPRFAEMGQGLALFAVGFVSGAIVLLNTTIWWERRKAFHVELLYPWSRCQLTLAAFGSIACEFAAMLAIPIALIVGACTWYRVPAATITAGIPAAIAVVALLTAGILWLLTLRNGVVAFLIGFGGIYALGFVIAASMYGIIREDAHFHERLPAALLAAALECILIAALLARLAYRRWMRTEWSLIR